LVLALDGRTKESGSIVASTVELIEKNKSTQHYAGAVVFDFALAMLVLAEVTAGRHTSAGRLLKRKMHSHHEAGICMRRAAESLARAAKSPSYAPDLEEELDGMREFGYGGYARYVEQVARHLEGQHEPATTVTLTPAEMRVVRDLAAGLTPKQIAAEMGRSIYTVQTHIQNVIDKFGCHGRAEAIAAARRIGLLDEA
ncbi:MAG TPA: LuxR C-terminal-related transcriptional regulator, partial [Candidatus Aquilonibacter sp.]